MKLFRAGASKVVLDYYAFIAAATKLTVRIERSASGLMISVRPADSKCSRDSSGRSQSGAVFSEARVAHGVAVGVLVG